MKLEPMKTLDERAKMSPCTLSDDIPIGVGNARKNRTPQKERKTNVKLPPLQGQNQENTKKSTPSQPQTHQNHDEKSALSKPARA